jgi:hypothetical protein
MGRKTNADLHRKLETFKLIVHCTRRHISQTSTKMFARINTHLIEINLGVYVLFYRKEFVLLNPNVTEVQL